MSSSSADFIPLSYDTVASLSVETRRAMTMDFVNAGAGERALSMLPLIPFAFKGSWQVEFDRRLAGAVCCACPPSEFPRVIQTLRASYEAVRSATQLPAPFDLGDVLIQLAGAARSARLANQPERAEAAREKMRMLLEEPDLSLRSSHQIPYQQAKDFAFVPRWLNSENFVSPSSVAFCELADEPWLWSALWRRPEWAEQLDLSIFPGAPGASSARRERGDVALLNRPEAWNERFEALNALFLERLRAKAASGGELPPVEAKILGYSLFPASPLAPESAREGVWAMFGERCYPMLLGREGGHAPRVEWNAQRLFQMFSHHNAKRPLPNEADSLARALFQHGHAYSFDSGVLRELLFSPKPELREALLRHYAPLPHPRDPAPDPSRPANPYADFLSLSTLSTALYAASRSDDPQTLERLFDAVGPAALAAHPGTRKGLDYSALMSVASNGSLAMFEAALKWADRHGVLDECAEAKAWVMSEGSTRKKGDLLALCVALADLDKASALLALRPDFKMTSARDTAKAMGDKLRSERAGRAVSAWESLLFSKTLAIKSADPDPASGQLDFDAPPASAPRRARL